MLGTERMKVKVCFLCLKTIKNIAFRKNADGKELDDLYFKFWRFAGGYLGIESGSNTEKSWMKECFCDECKNVVSSLCQLYLELLQVQLRLSSKLGELLRLLESSESGVSHKLGRVLIKSLAEQLGFAKRADVDELRSLLKEKCKVKSQEALPEILIHRVELPPSFSYPNIAKDIKLEITSDNFLEADGDDDYAHASPLVEDEDCYSISSEENSNQGDGAPPKRSIDAVSGARGVDSENGDAIPEIKIEPSEVDEQDIMNDDDKPMNEIKRKEESDSDSTFESDASPEHNSNESDSDSQSDWEPEEKSKKVKPSSTSMKSTSKMQSPLAQHEQPKKENRKQNQCVCQHCGKVLISSQRLRHHIYQVHRGHPFQCSECSKSFKTKAALKDHAIRTHSETIKSDFKVKKHLKREMKSTASTDAVSGTRGVDIESDGKIPEIKIEPLEVDEQDFMNEDDEPIYEIKEKEESDATFESDASPEHNSNESDSDSQSDWEPEEKSKKVKPSSTSIKSTSKMQSPRAHHEPTKEENRQQIDFVCQHCGKDFPSNQRLRHHIYQVHRGHPFQCSECSKPFKTKSGLKDHTIKFCHGKSDLKTEKLYKKVSPRFTSTSISSNVPGKEDVICTTCSKSFSTQQKLFHHTYKVHNEMRPCEICEKNFKTKQGLHEHLIVVHSIDPHSCPHPDCQETFRTQALLRFHVKNMHLNVLQAPPKSPPPPPDRPLQSCGKSEEGPKSNTEDQHRLEQCPTPNCPRSYFNMGALQRHLVTCGQTEEKVEQNFANIESKDETHICDQCGKVFQNATHLKKHVYYSHLRGEKKRNKYPCPNCVIVSQTQKKLDRHLKHCSAEKPFYKGRTALDPGRKQLRVIRYDDKPDAEGKYPCPHCPKVYLNAIQRGRHLHYTHPAVPFICSHCGVTRSTNSALQRHITAFHKPKDRLCPHCGKTLATSYMAVHIRLVHPQYAPKRIRYSCPNCSEGFYAKSQLEKHSLECPGRSTDAVGDLKTE